VISPGLRFSDAVPQYFSNIQSSFAQKNGQHAQKFVQSLSIAILKTTYRFNRRAIKNMNKNDSSGTYF